MRSKIGNKNALKHGGEAAVKDLQVHQPLRDLAHNAQEQVHADYEAGGIAAMMQENAERLQAVSRLFWEACQAAAQAGNVYALDGFVARYGWLAGSAQRAWAEVAKQNGKKSDKAAQILEAMKDG
jgi:hypothetical protein